jgi:hypothetical protein
MDYSVKTHLTRDDVIRSGACIDGVDAFCKRHSILATAMPVETLVALARRDDEDDRVLRAANLDGYGNGDGYGDGNGDGNGDGYGDGYGYGYGYGYGDGYGDGNGDGNGDGDGYGYGYGYGYGEQEQA